MSTFPNNSLSHYHVALPERLRLNGEWDMAMVEIQYPARAMNVSAAENENYIIYRTPEMLRYWHVPPGYYSTADKLVEAINKIVTLPGFEMTYNKNTQKIHVKVGDDEDPEKKLAFSDSLGAMLGFKASTSLSRLTGKHNIADYPVDVHRGIHNYYVYVDMAEHVIVGNVRAPLLRIVPIEYEETNATTKTIVFDSPHYIPVRKSETETVEVNITDDTGRSIPFTHGKTYVKVHFRPRQPDYLT